MGSTSVSAPSDFPTVLHITHPKAGSQWLHKLLHQCAPERIVTPLYEMKQFFGAPIRRGMIYPALYVTKQDVDRVQLPDDTRRLVVIRDLRDTLISWYFSLKFSHIADHPVVIACRSALMARSLEDGLLWALDYEHFRAIADIQLSWARAGVPVIRYEDLLVRDEEIFERVLLGEYGMPVARGRLREIVHATRFASLTGRARGVEDINAHERKGIAGDWRNHFTEHVSRAFKDRYADVLIAMGYETGRDW